MFWSTVFILCEKTSGVELQINFKTWFESYCLLFYSIKIHPNHKALLSDTVSCGIL